MKNLTEIKDALEEELVNEYSRPQTWAERILKENKKQLPERHFTITVTVTKEEAFDLLDELWEALSDKQPIEDKTMELIILEHFDKLGVSVIIVWVYFIYKNLQELNAEFKDLRDNHLHKVETEVAVLTEKCKLLNKR